MLICESLDNANRYSNSPATATTLAELREVVRDMTRRIAMLEVEAAGRQAGARTSRTPRTSDAAPSRASAAPVPLSAPAATAGGPATRPVDGGEVMRLAPLRPRRICNLTTERITQ